MFRPLESLGLFAIVVWFLTSANAHNFSAAHLYKAKGGDVILDPLYSGPPITSIEWKHGSDMAAEWAGEDPECFLKLKGRCTLDRSTGVLTITGLNGSENGIFSVVINNTPVDMKISLSVISKVPKPIISSQCDTGTTYCNLTCDGNTTDAEPASYTWFAGGSERGSGKELKITEETEADSFTCMLKNPVSNQSSDSFSNPIIKGKRNRMISIIVPTVLIVLALIVVLIVVFIFMKKKNGHLHYLNGDHRGAKRGTKKEYKAKLSNGQAGQHPNVMLLSEVKVESSSASAVTQNGVGGSDSEAQRVIEVQAHVEPKNNGDSSEEAPLMAETSKQDPESTESPGPSEETENSAGTSNNPESTSHKLTLGEEEADGRRDGD